MELSYPVIITSRLLPGVAIGKSTISIEYSDNPGDDMRERYRYFLDLELDGKRIEYTADDIQSGNGCNNSLQDGLESLLAFMGACGESYAYAMRQDTELSDTENGELFPKNVAEWCYINSDELSMVAAELEETENAILE
jgi:hypothetical protein